MSAYIVADANTPVEQINADADAATISLYTDGKEEAVYTATASGSALGKKTGSYSAGGIEKATYEVNAAYELQGVSAGTYTMTLRMKNNGVRSYTVTVAAEQAATGAVTQDAELKLLGDVDGDGKITLRDADLTYRHAAGKLSEPLSAYQISCADVFGRGTVSMSCADKIHRHVAGKVLLWE